MSEPTPEQIAAAFDEKAIPRLPPMPSGLSGNVICAVCIIGWLDEGHFWQGERIEVVTVYKGAAVCLKHLKKRLEADRA